MKRFLAASLITALTWGGAPAVAQEAGKQVAPEDEAALQSILNAEIPQETLDLALQLVQLSGTSRTFDELLPNIADQAKNAFVRANPQMQLGIIEVVDRVAREMVSRRPELDNYLARAWASGFTAEELQELIDFYSTETGKKFAATRSRMMAVELAAAQEWTQSVGRELQQKVSQQLQATMAAEESQLTGQAPAAAPAAPAQ